MTRIADTFERLKEQGRTALVPYVTAGYPRKEATVDVLHALVEAGSDIIELGIPFSDPMADGPVIQKACEAAIAAGTTLQDVLHTAQAFRADNETTPIVLMGYLNPIEFMGVEAFAETAAQCGVDGVLLVDLPAEECASYKKVFAQHGLDLIFLVAPTTTEARLETILSQASGFVYYVSLKGVTGSGDLDVPGVCRAVQGLRNKSRLPVGIGFGIKTPQHARDLCGATDAIVIGSALLEAIGESNNPGAAAKSFLAPIRQAIDTEQNKNGISA